MKIAQVANIWQSIPPKGYGGTERVIYDLCQGLTKKGHQVILFASGDSKINDKISYIFKEKLLDKNISWSHYLNPLLHFTFAYEQIKKAGDFDIVHGHYSLASDLISLSFAQLNEVPTLFTAHYPFIIDQKYDDRKKIFEYCNRVNFVSISNKQRTLPLKYISTIYHGIDILQSPFSDRPTDEYILWLGRIVPEKGLDYALDLAIQLKKKLMVVGRVDKENEANYKYFQTKIKNQLINPQITSFETVDTEKRNELLLQSKCFLFPIKWEEPFGLVMIEAMACGTPVIAFARGSVPEVVRDGETGFIVNSSDDDIRGDFIIKKTGFEGLKEAVEKIYNMADENYKQMRIKCRKHVEINFSLDKMVDEYENVYKKIIANKKND